MTPTSILKQYFGYDKFRTGQLEIIDAILQNKDALAIMPTGAGKSLCFQVPAMLLDGITLVVSPLISLMQDQVNTLVQAGIPAAYINSSLSSAQSYKVLSNAKNGAYKIIYVAPERLELSSFQDLLKTQRIAMVAVDEAHCISHWGQDFRPSYLHISDFVKFLPTRPILTAFTATATDIVKDDIIKLLGLFNPFTRSTGFNRANLYFEVRHPNKKFAELTDYLSLADNKTKSGIIYCATRKTVDQITDKLISTGIPATRYHAGMTQNDRTRAQQDFLYDRIPLIVATNAFGMGIDKSNVSFVVHYNMPKNMESYYQEAGRAGRDGSPAKCILLFNRQDIMINRFLIESSEADEDIKTRDYRRLREMEAYCTTSSCLRQYILNYFQDEEKYECDYCSNCNTNQEMVDVTIDAQKILSCIHRMKGRFGQAMVIDVLRGAKTKKVLDANMDKLKTYGVMEDRHQADIRHIIHYLIGSGYIRVVGDRYPVIQTTEMANNVLYNKELVNMPIFETTKQSTSTKQGVNAANQDQYSELFKQLKALRLSLASDEGVPAFVIFSDATLYDMCAKLPANEKEFLNVSGVGEVKLKKYGHAFLEVIEERRAHE